MNDSTPITREPNDSQSDAKATRLRFRFTLTHLLLLTFGVMLALYMFWPRRPELEFEIRSEGLHQVEGGKWHKIHVITHNVGSSAVELRCAHTIGFADFKNGEWGGGGYALDPPRPISVQRGESHKYEINVDPTAENIIVEVFVRGWAERDFSAYESPEMIIPPPS